MFASDRPLNLDVRLSSSGCLRSFSNSCVCCVIMSKSFLIIRCSAMSFARYWSVTALSFSATFETPCSSSCFKTHANVSLYWSCKATVRSMHIMK